jgi:hypothetical protein
VVAASGGRCCYVQNGDFLTSRLPFDGPTEERTLPLRVAKACGVFARIFGGRCDKINIFSGVRNNMDAEGCGQARG